MKPRRYFAFEASICPECGRVIPRGARINYVPGCEITHKRCPAGRFPKTRAPGASVEETEAYAAKNGPYRQWPFAGRLIKAGGFGYCPDCGEVISPGEDTVHDPSVGVVHLACYKKNEAFWASQNGPVYTWSVRDVDMA